MKMKNRHKGMYVALFQSLSLAIRAEKTTKKAGIDVKLIPTPRYLSVECGNALRFHKKDKDKVMKVLVRSDIKHEKLAVL